MKGFSWRRTERKKQAGVPQTHVFRTSERSSPVVLSSSEITSLRSLKSFVSNSGLAGNYALAGPLGVFFAASNCRQSAVTADPDKLAKIYLFCGDIPQTSSSRSPVQSKDVTGT